jgi:hypothetical protein
VWGIGNPDGVSAPAPNLYDGIVVRAGSDNVVWLLTAGSGFVTPAPQVFCPCELAFANTTVTIANLNAIGGPHWTCDRAASTAAQTLVWMPLFQATSTILCNAAKQTGANAVWFQRTLSSPQRTLSVSICKEQADADEDLKLSSGDLFVRGTVGFNKQNCPKIETMATTTTSTAATTAIIGATSLTSTNTAIAPTVNPTTTALLSISTTATPSSSAALELWVMIVIVGGAVLALVLVGLAVFCLVKRRLAQQPTVVNNAAELKQPPQSKYGLHTPSPTSYGDVTDVRGVNPQATYDAPDSTLKF